MLMLCSKLVKSKSKYFKVKIQSLVSSQNLKGGKYIYILLWTSNKIK